MSGFVIFFEARVRFPVKRIYLFIYLFSPGSLPQLGRNIVICDLSCGIVSCGVGLLYFFIDIDNRDITSCYDIDIDNRVAAM